MIDGALYFAEIKLCKFSIQFFFHYQKQKTQYVQTTPYGIYLENQLLQLYFYIFSLYMKDNLSKYIWGV